MNNTFTTEQAEKLNNLAQEKGLGVGEMIWKQFFPDEKFVRPLRLTEDEVLQRLKNLKTGDQFTLESLFSYEEWKSFSNTISIGREFRKKTKDPLSEISQYVSFVDKKPSNLAIYSKR